MQIYNDALKTKAHLVRWWKKADEADSCKTSTKTSELHPEQLFGVFLLLVVAMVLVCSGFDVL